MDVAATTFRAQVTADFDSFYLAEYPKVYRAARAWTGQHEAAVDATQEAFARAYARWRRLNDEEWRGGWVMTTALNLCKKRSRIKEVGPPKVVTATFERIDVTAALKQLPEKQRLAAVLFYIGDLPLPAVAEAMDISEGTVKSHLNRARQSMKKYLEVKDE